jgi:hypothetical protein
MAWLPSVWTLASKQYKSGDGYFEMSLHRVYRLFFKSNPTATLFLRAGDCTGHAMTKHSTVSVPPHDFPTDENPITRYDTPEAISIVFSKLY